MSAADNIWNNGKGKLPDDKLLAYTEGRLNAAEQREVEAWLAEEGMEADALEGLQQLPAAESKEMVNKLNHQLHQAINAKTRRKAKPIKDNNQTWVAVIIVLLLCIAAYMVLHYMMK